MELADEIRRVASAMEGPVVGREAIDAFARLIGRVNQLLGNCVGLIRAGHREDAMRIAGATTGLIACLGDLEALQRVVDSTVGAGVEVAGSTVPRLMEGAAHEILTASDVHRQVVPLLRTHRLLALGGGSLALKVVTLRKLLELDPNHLGWRHDVGEYEKVWRTALESELDSLAEVSKREPSTERMARAEVIISTLADSGWQQPLDGQEIRTVQHLLAGVREAWARAELASLITTISDETTRASPVAEVAAVRERLGAIQLKWPASERDPSARTVQEWIARTDAVAAAIEARKIATAAAESTRLQIRENLIRGPQRPTDVYRRLAGLLRQLDQQEAVGGDGQSSVDVRREAMLRLEELAKSIRLRRVGAIAIVLTALASSLLGLSHAVNLWRARLATQHAIRAVEHVLEHSGSRDAARAWSEVVAVMPHLRAPAFEAMLKEAMDADAAVVDGLDRSCLKRVSDVERRLAMVQSSDLALFTGESWGVESLGQACDLRDSVERELGRLDEEMTDVERDLEEMQRLGGEEQAAVIVQSVASLRMRLASADQHFRSAEVEMRSRLLTGIASRLEVIEATGAPADEAKAEIAELYEAVDVGGAFLGHEGEVLKTRLKASLGTQSRLAAIEAFHARLGTRDSTTVDEYIGDLLDQKDSLDQQIPGIGEAIDVVGGRLAAYRAVEAWSEVAAAWACVRGLPGPAAAAFRDAVVKARESPLRPPDESNRLARLVDCLGQRVAGCPQAVATVVEYLERPVMRAGVQVAVHDRRTFYMPPGATRGYFVDEDTVHPLSATTDFLSAGPLGPAPHVNLVASICEHLRSAALGSEDVDDALAASISLVGASSVSDDGVDPVLQCRLMMALLDVARTRVLYDRMAAEIIATSESMRRELGRSPVWVKSTEVTDEAAWQVTRDRARRVLPVRDELARIVGEPASYAAVLEQRPKLCRPFLLQGWMDVGGKDCRLRVFRATDAMKDGSLLVVRPDDGGGWTLVPIGEVRGGDVQLGDVTNAIFGEPVWLEK